MQVRAILEAAAEVGAEGNDVQPEAIDPLAMTREEARAYAHDRRARRQGGREQDEEAVTLPLRYDDRDSARRPAPASWRRSRSSSPSARTTSRSARWALPRRRRVPARLRPRRASSRRIRSSRSTSDGVGALVRLAVERGRMARADQARRLRRARRAIRTASSSSATPSSTTCRARRSRVTIARLAAAQAEVTQKRSAVRARRTSRRCSNGARCAHSSRAAPASSARIAQRLVGEGHEVTVLDNLFTGHRRNIEGDRRGVRFVEGDVRSLATVEECAHGCDVVFHQAAIVSVPFSVERPQESHDVNIRARSTCCRRRGQRRCGASCSRRPPRSAARADAPPARGHAAGADRPSGVEKSRASITSPRGANSSGRVGGAALLQRVRPAPGPGRPTRASSASSWTGSSLGSPSRSSATARRRATSCTSPTSSTRTSRRDHGRRLGPRVQRGVRKTSLLELCTMIERAADKKVERTFGEPRAGDIRTPSPTSGERARSWRTRPKIDVETGLRNLVSHVAAG